MKASPAPPAPLAEDAYLEKDDEISPDASADRKFITALARGFEVLRAFKPGSGALGNQELSRITHIPKATVSRLTHTLSELGYLRHLKAEGKYEPTESILALGYAVLSNMLVRQIATARCRSWPCSTRCRSAWPAVTGSA